MVLKLFFIFYFSLFTFAYAVETPKRIVSLAPSMTEILFELGLEDNIIGVTNYCDYPERAKQKAKIGGMSNPSLEAVVALKPDIVVMTTDGNPREFEERLRLLKIKTYVFKARRLAELPDGIRKLGISLGVKEKADVLAKEIETTLTKFRSQKPVGATLSGDPYREVRSRKKKTLFIVWPEPLIVAGPGTAIDDVINLLGYENIASKAKSTYPKYSIEEVIRQSPDIIFIGRQMGRDIREVSSGLLQKITNVPAVKNNKIFYVGDNLYRMGPRAVKGIEEISECLK